MSVASDAGYILKQHQFPGPELAKRRFWQQSESIVGPRLSYTKFALALVGKVEPKAETDVDPAPPQILDESRANIIEPNECGELVAAPVPEHQRESLTPAKDISSIAPEMQWSLDTFGQLLMFDLPEQRHAPSGHAGMIGLPRPKRHVTEQAELPIESGPDAVDMLLALGPTHPDIAAKIGWSRTQVSDVINGRLRASRRMVSKVLAHAAQCDPPAQSEFKGISD